MTGVSRRGRRPYAAEAADLGRSRGARPDRLQGADRPRGSRRCALPRISPADRTSRARRRAIARPGRAWHDADAASRRPGGAGAEPARRPCRRRRTPAPAATAPLSTPVWTLDWFRDLRLGEDLAGAGRRASGPARRRRRVLDRRHVDRPCRGRRRATTACGRRRTLVTRPRPTTVTRRGRPGRARPRTVCRLPGMPSPADPVRRARRAAGVRRVGAGADRVTTTPCSRSAAAGARSRACSTYRSSRASPDDGRTADRLLAIPFRQVTERGFEAHDDGTPLVVVDIDVRAAPPARRRRWPRSPTTASSSSTAAASRATTRSTPKLVEAIIARRDRPGRGRQPRDRPPLPRRGRRLGRRQGAHRLQAAAASASAAPTGRSASSPATATSSAPAPSGTSACRAATARSATSG